MKFSTKSQLIIISITLTLILYLMTGAGIDNQDQLLIMINNPYSVKVKFELKCDYDNKAKKYKLYKKYLLPKKSRLIIDIPRGSRRCQVWPQVKYF